MPRALYVANLSRLVGRDELERLFARHGTVLSAEVVNQLQTADVTGTGHVAMDSEEQGEAAIAALNGLRLRGSELVVGWAAPGQRRGIDLSRMFRSMDIPGRAGAAKPPTPARGFGGKRLPRSRTPVE